MAQPPKPAIPPDPNANKNIHGQQNPPAPSEADQAAKDAEDREIEAKNRQHGQVNIHGQAPKPHMAPQEESQKGLGDNTKAEMDAGKANLSQYAKRNDAEHEAGRHANEQRSQRESQK